jgi:hypothetical protein
MSSTTYEGNPDIERTEVPVGFTPSDPVTGAGVERFFAAYMPNRASVMLFFDHGNVELTRAESEALEACLSGANQIARGAHAVQAVQSGGAK